MGGNEKEVGTKDGRSSGLAGLWRVEGTEGTELEREEVTTGE